jgi:Cytochrome oxidase c subunit VIb
MIWCYLYIIWQARDAFYACVEKAVDKQPTEIATGGLLFPSTCKKSRAIYVSSCRPSWVRLSLLSLLFFSFDYMYR